MSPQHLRDGITLTGTTMTSSTTNNKNSTTSTMRTKICIKIYLAVRDEDRSSHGEPAVDGTLCPLEQSSARNNRCFAAASAARRASTAIWSIEVSVEWSVTEMYARKSAKISSTSHCHHRYHCQSLTGRISRPAKSFSLTTARNLWTTVCSYHGKLWKFISNASTITTMPCWPGRQGLSPIGFSAFWMQWHVLLMAPGSSTVAWPICYTPSYTGKVASCQRLRSASRHQLVVPLYRRSKFGRRAFSVTGPMVWNSLPDHLRDPTLGSDCFKSRLKTHLFSLY